jgi:hypothetical protein
MSYYDIDAVYTGLLKVILEGPEVRFSRQGAKKKATKWLCGRDYNPDFARFPWIPWGREESVFPGVTSGRTDIREHRNTLFASQPPE